MSIFDEIADDAFGPPPTPARGTVSMVSDRNPDTEAVIQRKSRFLGVPFDSARSDPRELDRQYRAHERDWLILQRRAPFTSKLLTDPQKASIAHDDIDNAASIEDYVRVLAPRPSLSQLRAQAALAALTSDPNVPFQWTPQGRSFMELATRPPVSGLPYKQRPAPPFAQGSTFMELATNPGRIQQGREAAARQAYVEDVVADTSPSNIGSSLLASLPRTARGLYGVMANPEYRDLALTGPPNAGIGSFFRPFLNLVREPLNQIAKAGADEAGAIYEQQRPKSRTMFGRDVLSGVESVPQSLLAAGVTLASGNPYAGATSLGLVTAGDSYVGALDAGLSPEQAHVKASIDGVIETATEIISDKLLLDDIAAGGVRRLLTRQFLAEVPSEQLATLGQDFNQWAMIDRNKGKTFDEYVAEIDDHARSTLISTLVTTGVVSGSIGAATRTMETLDNITGRAVRRDLRAAEAQAAADHLADLDKLVTASKLRERDPQTFQQFLAEAAEGSAIEDIYVDPAKLGEVLNQDTVPAAGESADNAASSREAIIEALRDRIVGAAENGHDVRIPVAEFETLLAGTPQGKALLDHIKTSPLGMSRAEAADYLSTGRGAELAREIDDAIAAINRDSERRAQHETVKSAVADQLTATRRFIADHVDRYAELVASVYSTLAQRYGTTADAMWQRFPLRIQATAPEGAVFDQSADQLRAPGFRTVDIGGARVDLTVAPDGSSVEVSLLSVPEAARRQGIARAAMQQIVANADANGQTLFLTAEPRGGIGKTALVGFYRSLGFVPNRGRAKDFRSQAAMVRHAANGSDVLLQPATPKRVYTASSGSGVLAPFNNAAHVASRLQAHPDYAAAKSGDMAAAIRVVQDLVPQSVLDQVRERFADAIFVPAIAEEAGGHNKLPHAYAEMLAAAAGGEVVYDIVQINRAFHTGAGAMERLLSRPLFDGPVEADQRYVIVDDVTTMGGTLAELANHVAAGGGEVIGAAVLVNASRNDVVAARPALVRTLERRFGDAIRDELGVDPSALTASEARYLAGFRDVDSLRNRIAKARRERVERLGAKGIRLPSGLNQGARGAFSPATDTITLLAAANKSTFLHESGHFFLELLHRMADDATAPQQMRDDFDTVLKWFGVSDRAAWSAMSLEEKRPHHEQWARGFEAYLFTGKAPSVRLQGLFRTFRNWLIAVYRAATGLNVTVSRGVRDVMDRLVATDTEIAEAEAARSMERLFAAKPEQMSEDQWREYQQLGANATAEAIEDLQGRSLRDMQWLNNARGREVAKLKRQSALIRKAVRAEVEAQILAEPIYRAITFLRRGLLDGQKVDGAHRFSIAEIDALYPEEAARNVVKAALGTGAYGMLSAAGGIHPEQVAEMFGFSSADHLIRSVIEAEPMRDRIDGLTEQRLLEDHGDLIDPQAIDEAANRAVHNEARARFVAAELAALNAALGRKAERRILESAARGYAAEAISRQRIRDLRPSIYEAAAARAGRAAMEASAKGNTSAAMAEKRNQLLNLHLNRAARQAREDVEKALAYFSRLQRPGAIKSIDVSYREQIETLLEAIDLRRSTTNRQIDSRQSLRDWIEKQREAGLDPIVPEDLIEQLGRRSYKELSVDELRMLVDSIKNIEHLGRLKNQLLTAKKQREFDQARDAMVDSIKAHAVKSTQQPLERGGWIDAAKRGGLAFFAMHRKLASFVRQIDGFREGGPLWEYIIRGMNAAGDREAVMRDEANRRLAEILKPVLAATDRKVFIPAIGTSLSLEGRLAVALNMGNAINRERLMSGERWSAEQVDAIATTLTAEQWGAVQQVWDYIGSFWPEIAAKERRVTGVTPERVDAEPLRVNTLDGQALDLAGGYYPIKYNTDRSAVSEAHDTAEVLRQSLRGAYARATTRRGHTKARVESTGRALRYDLGVITQHVSEVTHDLAWHEWLIDANRILNDRKIDAALREHYGPEVIRSMKGAVKDIAVGELPAQTIFESWLGHLRAGVTISTMGWSFTTAAIQFTGFSQSLTRLGARWMGRGLARVVGGPKHMNETLKWVREQSPFMRTRAVTQQREINEIMNQIRGKNGKVDAVRASFFAMIAKMQLMVDLPTWAGAYEQAIDAGRDHETAVALADQSVIDTQGGGQVKDLSRAQRGSTYEKLFTNFYSYFNVTQNLMAEEIGRLRLEGANRAPAFVTNMLLLSVVPATLGYLIKAALRPGDDDPEELAAGLAKENISFFFGLFIGLRDIGQLISTGRSATPAGLVGERVAKVYEQAGQGEVDEAALRAVNSLAGVVFKYPAVQLDRTTRGANAILEGETVNPLALLFGPPKEKRGR